MKSNLYECLPALKYYFLNAVFIKNKIVPKQFGVNLLYVSNYRFKTPNVAR